MGKNRKTNKETTIMVTTSKTDYASAASTDYEPTPVVEGFQIGDHDVKVIIDNNKDKSQHRRCSKERSYGLENDPALAGSRRPVNLAFCPHCAREHVRTRTRTYPNFVTWTCVAVGAVIFFPICWVPLVVDKMKKTDHYCQNCGQKLGSIKPLEGLATNERM